jgi:hypothetical protein
MYALHDAGLAVNALPTPQRAIGPTDQLEKRAVEATERGSQQADDYRSTMYSSTSAVLQLVKSSAEGFAEMLEVVDEADGTMASVGARLEAGQQVDVYA